MKLTEEQYANLTKQLFAEEASVNVDVVNGVRYSKRIQVQCYGDVWHVVGGDSKQQRTQPTPYGCFVVAGWIKDEDNIMGMDDDLWAKLGHAILDIDADYVYIGSKCYDGGSNYFPDGVELRKGYGKWAAAPSSRCSGVCNEPSYNNPIEAIENMCNRGGR